MVIMVHARASRSTSTTIPQLYMYIYTTYNNEIKKFFSRQHRRAPLGQIKL